MLIKCIFLQVIQPTLQFTEKTETFTLIKNSLFRFDNRFEYKIN